VITTVVVDLGPEACVIMAAVGGPRGADSNAAGAFVRLDSSVPNSAETPNFFIRGGMAAANTNYRMGHDEIVALLASPEPH
jgi:hypothetical protein